MIGDSILLLLLVEEICYVDLNCVVFDKEVLFICKVVEDVGFWRFNDFLKYDGFVI